VIAILQRTDQGLQAAFLRRVALQARHQRRHKLSKSTACLILREAEPLTDLPRGSSTGSIH